MLLRINLPAYFYYAFILLSCVSCKKFLTTNSTNDSFINNSTDLNEVLIGGAYLPVTQELNHEFIHCMDDDIKLAAGSRTTSGDLNYGFYTWAQNPRQNGNGTISTTDNFYQKIYNKIAITNSIFASAELLRQKGQTGHEIDRISAEAYFLRAYYYFLLANTYAKPYSITTAHSDLGVPLKVEVAIKDQFAVRATIAEVFNLIVSDLHKAESLIKQSNAGSRIRVNATSIHALLSRVYLYMENYPKAIFHADMVISDNDFHLLDLNGFDFSKGFATMQNPELLFTMSRNDQYVFMANEADVPYHIHYQVSADLKSVYANNDLRVEAFFNKNSEGGWKIAKKRNSGFSTDDAADFHLIRLSEVYLNKAEALALSNQELEAKATLQALRIKRLRPEASAMPAINGTAVVDFIREERRRELCFEGHRWFDLRRYAVNKEHKFTQKIRHNYLVFENSRYRESGYFELGTYDEDAGAYIVPIAADEIDFNQGRLFNEYRIERSLKF